MGVGICEDCINDKLPENLKKYAFAHKKYVIGGDCEICYKSSTDDYCMPISKGNENALIAILRYLVNEEKDYPNYT